MADDKKTDETPAATPEATVEETKVQPKADVAPAAEAPVEAKKEAAPAAEAPVEAKEAAAPAAEPKPETVVDNAGSTPTPSVAPTQAAEAQSAASGAPSQPRSNNRGGNNRGGQGGGQGGRGRGGGRDNNRRGGRDEPDDGLTEKLVHINRVSKTVKGGKRFGFAALVVVGDGAGRVGFGKGKAREVPEAITKATAAAKKKMIRVSLKEGRTLHHDGKGRFGAGLVNVRSAPPGTGIIAGGPMRAVFESLGVADVVTKSMGTSNPYNMIRATFDALVNQTSPKSVAQRRGKKVSDLLGRGGSSEAEAEADAAAITE